MTSDKKYIANVRATLYQFEKNKNNFTNEGYKKQYDSLNGKIRHLQRYYRNENKKINALEGKLVRLKTLITA